jgi:predicted transcriptional regulator YheO
MSFPDGRAVKSTSIGLRNSEGKFVAAICLNLDISLFSSVQQVLARFTAVTEGKAPILESLNARSAFEVRQTIEQFAARYNMQPRTLTTNQRREVVQALANAGLMQMRGAASTAAEVLGVSRASIYNALKD